MEIFCVGLESWGANEPFLRACLHECGGPQVGEVTCGGLPHLSCKRDHLKIERLYIWTGGLPHLSGLPHYLAGYPTSM